MAVTAIREGITWGGNRSFHLALIGACRQKLGALTFLDRFEQSFAHGYNCIDLEKEADENVRVYRDCVAAFVQDPQPLRGLVDRYGAANVISKIQELVDLIDSERLNAP